LNVDIINQLSQKDEQLLKHFAKTVSITLGRLCFMDPQNAAYCLPKVIKPWCIALRYIDGSDEKVQAYKGLCAMIPYNPIGIAESFPYFCEALIEFKAPPRDLEYTF
jgi:transportin-1